MYCFQLSLFALPPSHALVKSRTTTAKSAVAPSSTSRLMPPVVLFNNVLNRYAEMKLATTAAIEKL